MLSTDHYFSIACDRETIMTFHNKEFGGVWCPFKFYGSHFGNAGPSIAYV